MKHIYVIKLSAVDCVTNPHLRFDVILAATYDALLTVYY